MHYALNKKVDPAIVSDGLFELVAAWGVVYNKKAFFMVHINVPFIERRNAVIPYYHHTHSRNVNKCFQGASTE